MTDVIEHEPIDNRARRAVTRLRLDTSVRPLPVLRLRSRRRRVVPVLAAVTAIAVVVGLVAIGTNRDGGSAGNDPTDPRWILTDLPDGWAITGASGPNPSSATRSFPLRWVVYATDQAPSGPIVAIVPNEFTDLADPSTVRHIDVDAKPAIVADSRGFGERWIDVELTPGRWVGMTTVALDEKALLAAGARLSLGADGLPMLAEPESLGLTLIGVGDASSAPAVASDSVETANTIYQSADGRQWSMSVGPSSDLAWAWWGLLGARSLGESGMFALGPPDSARGIVWEHDGLAFSLELVTGGEYDETAMVRAAKSARTATDAEWSGVTNPPDGLHPVDTALASTETSMANEPEGSWTDVRVETTVAKLDDFDYRLTFTLPDHTTSTLEVRFLGRSMDCGTLLTGISGGGAAGGGTVCMVADPRAPFQPVALRIYGPGGIRYVLDMQTIEGVTFAVYHVDGVDTPRAEIVGKDGTIEPF